MENDVIKPLTECTDEEIASVRDAEAIFIEVHETTLRRPMTTDELLAIHDEIEAMRKPVNDVMSFVFGRAVSTAKGPRAG